MRIVLVVVVGVIVLVLGVVVVGAMLPKRHSVSRSASYRATPEQLLFLIVGTQKWRPEVARCETVFRGSGRELMQEMTRGGETITYELLESVPPKSVNRRIATENLPYSGSWTYLLERSGAATIVRITEDGEVYNPVFRFVSRFVLGQTRTMDAYLQD